jgi:hypothetical protein
LDYLYLEPEVIDFFAEMAEFRSFASDSFDRCLVLANNLLRLKYSIEVGVPRCSADIDVASDIRVKTLNSLAEISFNLPTNTAVQNKLSVAIDRLHSIILRILREMVQDCRQNQKETVLDDAINAPFASPGRGPSSSNMSLSSLY